jgi:hypothetical protein
MKFLTKTAVLFSILFTLSCQTMSKKQWTSEDLLIPENSSLEALAFAQSISQVQASQDIHFLIYLLNNAYGGRKYVDPNALKAAIQSLQSIDTSLNLIGFHDRIDEALFLIPDNHLFARYKGKVSKKREAYENQEVGSVGKNNITDPKTVWEVRLDSVKRKKILYISIVRFPPSQSEIWKGFLETVRRQKKNADAIVFDLRGNSGGDDTKGMELAEILFGNPIEHPIKIQYRSQVPDTLALFLNRLNLDIIDMKYDKLEIPNYLKEDFKYAKKQYELAVDKKIPLEFIRTNKGKGSRLTPITGFKKPIYILMDRSCGSSCEFTIAAFEWNKYVKRVGENTSGTFHFSNAGLALLPNSKFRIWVPTQFSEYFDKRFIERIGFSPDIRVPKGQDAYVAVKKLL